MSLLENNKRTAHPLRLLLVTSASVFIAEAVVMLILGYLPGLSLYSEALLDAFLLSLLAFPLLYLFLFRPMLKYTERQRGAEHALRKSGTELEKKVVELEAAQQALRDSEEQYRLLFDRNPNPMWIYDLETLSFLLVNNAAVIQYGYSKEEFLSMTIKDIRPREDVPALLDNISKVTDGIDNAGMWRHLRKDGALVFVDIISQTLTFMGRRTEIVVAYDITKRIQAEAELYKTKNQLEDLVAERTSELQKVNLELITYTETLEKKNKEAELLSQMAGLQQICNTSEEAYAVVRKFASQLFYDDSGELLIVNQTNILGTVVSWGEVPSVHDILSSEDCWALRKGQIHISNKEALDLRCGHIKPDTGIHICIPMVVQGSALGVFHLIAASAKDSPDLEQQLKDKRRLALTVSEQISLSLANIKLREMLRDMSVHDPLTGLFNRRYLNESFRREIHRAGRKGASIGVIMLDIDYFKKYNDTLGHDAGDAFLQELGRFLQKNTRLSDIVCRYGGEEFVVVLPEAPLEATKERAEYLRNKVKHLKIEHEGIKSIRETTLSLGVSVFPDNGTTAEEVIKAADEALYDAKNKGRDCVCVTRAKLTKQA